MAGKVEGTTVCGSSCMVSGKTTATNTNDVATKSYTDTVLASAGSTSPQIHFIVVGGGGGGGSDQEFGVAKWNGAGGGGGIWMSSDYLVPDSPNWMFICIGAGGAAGNNSKGFRGGQTFFWKGLVAGGGGGGALYWGNGLGISGAYGGGSSCNCAYRGASGLQGSRYIGMENVDDNQNANRFSDQYDSASTVHSWVNPDGSYIYGPTSVNMVGGAYLTNENSIMGGGPGPVRGTWNTNTCNGIKGWNGVWYSSGGAHRTTGTSVPANTGCGGYARGDTSSDTPTAGSSGVVIIRFDSSITVSVGGGLTSSSISSGGQCTYCFTAGADCISFSGV